jgi:PTH1 family peptidyl-tRNA hydrolase
LRLPGASWLRGALRAALGLGRPRERTDRVDRLIVGLGNPGPRYAQTRHNVGFRVVEAFAQRHAIALDRELDSGRFGVGEVAGQSVGLLEPQTFMNASGECVAAFVDRLADLDVGRHLIVVYDDLDLSPGRIRLRAQGGAGGHRGMSSVVAALGRNDIARLRFGIGRPAQGVAVIDHVLGEYDEVELAALHGPIVAAADALDRFALRGISLAMDSANAAPSQGDTG